MKPKHKRMTLLAAGLVFLAGAVALALFALRENITFFFTPDAVVEGEAPRGRTIRLGGFVQEDSLRQLEDGATYEFVITDRGAQVRVVYRGVLPDLFREGQGVVAEGRLNDEGDFMARQVLARHDENYMPAELVDELRERGIWHRRDETYHPGGDQQPTQ